ncbi:MAG: type II toxin-antitoxin system RelE/ParE family toxin [Albidovulum sp.]|nr:type II toxin-antitoxin system RelE/ParE family toxin [Albidovulum sp.]
MRRGRPVQTRSGKGKPAGHATEGYPGKGFPADLFKAAARKTTMLDAAPGLDDLRVPPANRLEVPKGDREGRRSMRVDSQWRICFIRTEQGPAEAEIADYPSSSRRCRSGSAGCSPRRSSAPPSRSS